jgi:hypothetical protein
MVGLSSKGETAILTPLTTTAYVSLHTADPGDTGANELSGGAYARLGPVTFANAGSNPTVASNSSVLTYAAATAAWGMITHFGVWDAATVGNFRGSGALTTPKTVNSGDTARFAANALTITAQ